MKSPESFIEKTWFIKGNNLAIAAVENALWDLMTKFKNKSLKTLISRP
ncbi:hypothetical protein [Fusibacter sp. 3D3]